MTDEPLINEADKLFRTLLGETDSMEVTEKLSLAGRLTAYLQVKHKLEPDPGKGGGFDEWRRKHETSQSAGSDRRRKPVRKRGSKHPANADAEGLADGLCDPTGDGRLVPRYSDDPGDKAAIAAGAHRSNGFGGDGDE